MISNLLTTGQQMYNNCVSPFVLTGSNIVLVVIQTSYTKCGGFSDTLQLWTRKNDTSM